MNNLEQLTCSRAQATHLMSLGIKPVAFMWWAEEMQMPTEEGEEMPPVKYEVCLFNKPQPGPDCLPAWSKAELDAMIGPEAGAKPDLFTKQQFGNSKMQEPETYPVFFIEAMKVFKNGAHASAAALIYLLEKRIITANEANDRYQKIFKPF